MAFEEVKRDVLARFRQKARTLPSDMPQRVKAEKMAGFGGARLRQAKSYVAAGEVSDYVFGLYEGGKFTFKMLLEIASARVDEATRDFLARAVVERKMTTSQFMKTKALLRNKCSVAEALAKATGQIPEIELKASERPVRSDTINDEIMRLGTQWRIKVQMAMDLLPATALEGASARMTIFKKAYELRHLVREQLAFIDQKVEQFLKEMEKHAAAEAGVASRREIIPANGGIHDHDPGDGSQDDEAHHSPVGSPEQAVQDPAQDA